MSYVTIYNVLSANSQRVIPTESEALKENSGLQNDVNHREGSVPAHNTDMIGDTKMGLLTPTASNAFRTVCRHISGFSLLSNP